MIAAVYHLLTRSVRALAGRFADPGSKLGRGVAGRTQAHERLAEWGRSARDPDRMLAWFHAPSVGEGLQAGAVIEALRALRPDAQIAYTHFSPSAESLAARLPVDAHDYLPWDLPDVVGTALDGLRPDVIVFTKTEVWPTLTAVAARRGIGVAIIGATVPPGAGRAQWPARALLRPTWRKLDLACAISEDDADALVRLGVRRRSVHVTGDPGIDSAARRADEADPRSPHLMPFAYRPAPTVVAGSTWPEDEAVLLPALSRVRGELGELRAVIAPHEPTSHHVSELVRAFESMRWPVATLSEVMEHGEVGSDVAVVVDSVGVLAQLYTVGTVAYVGGGFGGDGLHSVLEPAAAALPTLIGPRHDNARAAADLVRAGGAKIASDTGSLRDQLVVWLTDGPTRQAAGDRSYAYIDGHRGASQDTARLLETIVRQRPGAPHE